MFVDERAMGERYWPARARLPNRYWLGILGPIPIALSCYSISIISMWTGNAALSHVLNGVAILSIAFALATGLVAIVRLRKA
jgi:hypothetical protein